MANPIRNHTVPGGYSTWVLVSVTLVWMALLVGCDMLTCDETAERSVAVPAIGIETVRVIAEAGTLSIEGGPDLLEIEAEGTACAGTVSDLDEMDFEVTTGGSEVVIEARTPSGSSRFDVRIDVPDLVLVEIQDGSGEIRVRDVAAVRITDGSGEVDAAGVEGDLVIEDDGSGGLDLRAVGGSVDIRADGSGDITVTDVNGDVRIGTDGSGDITVIDVHGDVRIGTDGSGDITVTDVGGDFAIAGDGSGTINYNNVEGVVDIPG